MQEEEMQVVTLRKALSARLMDVEMDASLTSDVVCVRIGVV
jgi:hypothetical protein